MVFSRMISAGGCSGSPGAVKRSRFAADVTLGSGTLSFDISPDGRRVAHERRMVFSDEVWALHLPSLLQKQP